MNNIRTYLILFGGVFALSTSAIWVRLAGAPSGVTAFYRLAITAVVLLPFFLLSKSCRQEVKALRRGQWIRIVAAGAFLALHYLLWFESLNYTSIASSTVIVCLQPLFSIVLERVILKSHFRPAALVGCGIALPLAQVGVTHDESGAPRYTLTGRAAGKMAALGGTAMHLSITHEGGMAAAVAILEG